MKKSVLLLTILRPCNTENTVKPIIKNINFPACKNCVYFKPENHLEFTSVLNSCEKFGEKDIITDKIKYDFVGMCRSNESKCGMDGKYFEEEKNIELKMLKHYVTRVIPYSIFVVFPALFLFIELVSKKP
jgi:hypothetical protein